MSAGAWARYQRMDLQRAPSHYAQVLRALGQSAPLFGLPESTPALAEALVALQPELDKEDQMALATLVVCVLSDLQQGSTRTPLAGKHLARRFTALLRPLGHLRGTPAEVLAAELHERVGGLLERASAVIGTDAAAQRPLIALGGEGGWLYRQRTLMAERALAANLAPRLRRPEEPPVGAPSERLTEEQSRAVAMALVTQTTLVSGGPGTGKTSIVVALLQALVAAGCAPERIAMAAPTGKAAFRMWASIQPRLGPQESDPLHRCPRPKTLHRLLGWSVQREAFRHHRHHPLEADVVIVDESSMVDLGLMERLVGALSPRAHLVLLGDADQLPSVAAGAVFRDLLGLAPTLRLTHSFRMDAADPAGAQVLHAAQAINAGEPPALIGREFPGQITGVGVEHLPAERRNGFLELWHRRHQVDPKVRERTWRLEADEAALDTLFEQQAQGRLLCMTRGHVAGADAVNAQLHALTAHAVGQPPGVPILVGEPVMMLHNDYERGLFNGDVGVVLWFSERGPSGLGRRRPTVVFPGAEGYRSFRLDTLYGRLELCYAMTVHKSQGSEFDHVAVLLPHKELPMLTRELLYTAVTRAKRGVVLVGDPALLLHAAQRRVSRSSGLAARLRPEEP